MYLNTTSPLAPALDALSATVAERGAFDRRQQGYIDAGILPAGAASQGGGPLSMLGLGSSPGGGQSVISRLMGGAAPAAPPAAPGPQATASQAAAPASTPSPLAGIEAMFGKAQQAYGVPAGYLPQLAALESKFNPSAVSPTGAKGLFQFTGDTAKRYGLADPTNVPDSVDKVGQLTRDNAASLRQSLGRDPTPGELYLAHQQGAAGAAALLKNPQLPAGQVLASIGADPKNITVNGGDPAMPAGAFAAKWTSRFGGGGAPVPGAMGAQQTSAGGAGGAGAPPSFPNAPSAMSGITQRQIQTLLTNPATEQIGLKLWESAATGKNYGFQVTPAGDVLRTNERTGTAEMVMRAPTKHEVKDFNGRLVDFDPQSSTTRDVTPGGLPQPRPATAAERKAYGVGPTTPFFFGPDGKPATLQGGTQVTVNNAVNPILKGLGDQFVEGAQGARDSADAIRSIQNARTQLQGGIVAGFGADQRLQLQKLGTMLGVGDPNKIENTETFLTQIKPLVLATVKGLGAGSGISNADRDFALQAVGGSIKLEAGTIGRVLDITERAARAKIDRHNGIADQMLKTQPDLAAVGPMLHVAAPPALQQTTDTGDPSGGVATVQTPEQARALPAGSRFRTPDGREFVR